MARPYLLVVAAMLVPPALSYGVDPAAILPKFMTINVEGTDETQRALMCPYLGMSTFCAIAALPEWRHVAVTRAVFFMFSIAAGRVLSIIVDGVPSRILPLYLAVELSLGLWGLAVLACER